MSCAPLCVATNSSALPAHSCAVGAPLCVLTHTCTLPFISTLACICVHAPTCSSTLGCALDTPVRARLQDRWHHVHSYAPLLLFAQSFTLRSPAHCCAPAHSCALFLTSAHSRSPPHSPPRSCAPPRIPRARPRARALWARTPAHSRKLRALLCMTASSCALPHIAQSGSGALLCPCISTPAHS